MSVARDDVSGVQPPARAGAAGYDRDDRRTAMANKVVHFEIYGDDVEGLADFYAKVFGWEITRVPAIDYWSVRTTPTDERGMPTEPGGINGGMAKRPMPGATFWVNYVDVPSVDDAVRKAEALGAKVVRAKTPVPRMGWFALLTDPQQNVFGLWQTDPGAG
jgi:predicted enzyme related to lactoylglutathione lyase